MLGTGGMARSAGQRWTVPRTQVEDGSDVHGHQASVGEQDRESMALIRSCRHVALLMVTSHSSAWWLGEPVGGARDGPRRAGRCGSALANRDDSSTTEPESAAEPRALGSRVCQVVAAASAGSGPRFSPGGSVRAALGGRQPAHDAPRDCRALVSARRARQMSLASSFWPTSSVVVPLGSARRWCRAGVLLGDVRSGRRAAAPLSFLTFPSVLGRGPRPGVGPRSTSRQEW